MPARTALAGEASVVAVPDAGVGIVRQAARPLRSSSHAIVRPETAGREVGVGMREGVAVRKARQ
jgi:hypothetical protein